MEMKRNLLNTVIFVGINFCKKVWAFEKALIRRILSRKEYNKSYRVEFVFDKVDPWIKEKVNSAKVITLAELEEM